LSEKRVKDKPSVKDSLTDLSSLIFEALTKGGLEIALEDVVIESDELHIILQQAVIPKLVAPPVVKRVEELLKVEFEEPKMEWVGKVVEVKIGATKGEGGTRSASYVVGGETAPPIYRLVGLEEAMPHRPVVAMDVFDMRIGLPRAIRVHVQEVMDDPAEWARLCVEKFGAKMINLHMVSTDPFIKDTPPKEAAKTVEEVLQAVKVPLCVGGSGNPKKDMEVFKAAADVSEGERILINSLNLDMDLDDIAGYLKDKDCVVIAFTPMDLDKARELNRKLYDYLPKDRIVMDTNTAGAGYGLDYGFSVMERARLAALKGDTELQQPIVAGSTNAWAAREAWLKMDPFWGPRELRGPIWETLTSLACFLTGADYFMMMHPLSIKTIEEIVDFLMKGEACNPEDIADWVSYDLG